MKPYDDNRSKTEQVQAMFDNIAPAYDRLNRAMSLGLDKSWRRKAVERVAANEPRHIVDIATGTADFAISLAERIPSANITGIDLSENMIEIGREKVARKGHADRISLHVGDCLNLSGAIAPADAVTVAFGVRNFTDIERGLRAMYGLLRPRGMICILELSTPPSAFVKPFYNLYAGKLIPLMGRMVSHDTRAYSYLPASIAAVPQGSDLLALMEKSGFVNTKLRRLSLGVCTLYTANTPIK